MKTIKTLFLASCFFSLASVFAQAPQKMSYQAVIRNASNNLVTNANIRMRISVLQGTATGTAVYVETQTTTTNLNGLATVEIGAGTVVSGTFATIAWGTNAYFIKTETDPTGGTNYSITETSQFLSVPYALFASNSASSGTIGQSVETNVYNLATGLQNQEVDFPTTNVTVPATGTYLITYFVDAYNTFTLDCINDCTDPRVDQTFAYLCNKTDGNTYQRQEIDFRSVDRAIYPGYTSVIYRLPSHQVTGSIVKQLFANQQIGVKLKSSGSATAVSEARIRQSTVTLIRLF